MARVLKRPMFRRDGSTNDGIMSGLVDREKKSTGDLIGRAKELTPELESLLREFTPKTRLPLGAVGAALVQGTPIRDALTAGYTDFTKRDDAREAAIRSGAVKLGIGQAMKEAQPSKNVLKNRRIAIANLKADVIKGERKSYDENDIILETAKLNKLDETGKALSPDRIFQSALADYRNAYGEGNKAYTHAAFDVRVSPKLRQDGKNPKGRIKLDDKGEYKTKRLRPGVYIDVENRRVVEFDGQKIIRLEEYEDLLK